MLRPPDRQSAPECRGLHAHHICRLMTSTDQISLGEDCRRACCRYVRPEVVDVEAGDEPQVRQTILHGSARSACAAPLGHQLACLGRREKPVVSK